MNITDELDKLVEENEGELSLTDCAYHFYDLAKQQMIEKAVSILRDEIQYHDI